jgi:hypothetical protein
MDPSVHPFFRSYIYPSDDSVAAASAVARSNCLDVKIEMINPVYESVRFVIACCFVGTYTPNNKREIPD